MYPPSVPPNHLQERAKPSRPGVGQFRSPTSAIDQCLRTSGLSCRPARAFVRLWAPAHGSKPALPSGSPKASQLMDLSGDDTRSTALKQNAVRFGWKLVELLTRRLFAATLARTRGYRSKQLLHAVAILNTKAETYARASWDPNALRAATLLLGERQLASVTCGEPPLEPDSDLFPLNWRDLVPSWRDCSRCRTIETPLLKLLVVLSVPDSFNCLAPSYTSYPNVPAIWYSALAAVPLTSGI